MGKNKEGCMRLRYEQGTLLHSSREQKEGGTNKKLRCSVSRGKATGLSLSTKETDRSDLGSEKT